MTDRNYHGSSHWVFALFTDPCCVQKPLGSADWCQFRGIRAVGALKVAVREVGTVRTVSAIVKEWVCIGQLFLQLHCG
jgi:hypothetical protein